MLETAAGFGKLVATGVALALGFWACKQLTNRIDTLIYTHSSEYKRAVEAEIAAAERVSNERLSREEELPVSV